MQPRTVSHHRHAPNSYASGPLDRADALRTDTARLARLLADPASRVTPVWRQCSLVAYREAAVEAVHLTIREAAPESAEAWIFLGLEPDGRAHFALDLSHHAEPPALADGVFEDLRKVGPLLPADRGAVLAYARGMVHWDRRHRFCGACGAPAAAAKGGHERRCTSVACGAVHFPRIDPAVIMLIHDGGDRAIMGRPGNWPPGRHSVLAGFVEPGESLEDAVAREVMEEVGVAVTDIRYRSSQPWPFPASVMLGFTGRAATTSLTLNDAELESARWMTRDELRASPEDDSFHLPRRDSIAYRLIADWLAESP